MFTKHFDQLEIGEQWFSRGRTVTESDLVMFSALSGDWYSLHTDKEWAASTIFGQRIAHGMLLLSITTGLMPFKPGVVVAFYGMDKVRFVSPVHIGDTISVSAELLDKYEKTDKSGISVINVNILNQRKEVVVAAVFKLLITKSEA